MSKILCSVRLYVLCSVCVKYLFGPLFTLDYDGWRKRFQVTCNGLLVRGKDIGEVLLEFMNASLHYKW
jgi:hypothetical protein